MQSGSSVYRNSNSTILRPCERLKMQRSALRKRAKPNSEIQTERSLLLDLNSDCRRLIFNQLSLKDLMNLAESSSSLGEIDDELFGNYSTFKFDARIIQKGVPHIKRVIYHIRPFVLSLNIDFGKSKDGSKWKNTTKSLSSALTKVINDCKNLQSLKISMWKYQGPLDIPASYCFNNVQMLTFQSCDFFSASTLLEKFRKLKYLRIFSGFICNEDLKIILQNNRNYIEGFMNRELFDLQLLELIPNVEQLYVTVSNTVSNFNSLLTLKRLKKLGIQSRNINISDLLRELAKKGIIEEMNIRLSAIDDNIFDILKLFDKLSTLVISINQYPENTDKWTLNSVVWPTKLKCLQLQNFYLTHSGFMSTLKQQKHLEKIDLETCAIAQSDQEYFNNSKSLFRQIVDVIGISEKKQRLDMVLPRCLQFPQLRSERYLFDSERLRILVPPGKVFWVLPDYEDSSMFCSFIDG